MPGAGASKRVGSLRNLRQQVIKGSDYYCEYCKTSSRLTGTPLVIDHIIPRSLGGIDLGENLAASCYRCNEFKGTKTHAVDPDTGQFVKLFNPRTQNCKEHFTWVNGGIHIAGLTPTGCATALALRLNNEDIVEARAIWIKVGWEHPPNNLQTAP